MKINTLVKYRKNFENINNEKQNKRSCKQPRQLTVANTEIRVLQI